LQGIFARTSGKIGADVVARLYADSGGAEFGISQSDFAAILEDVLGRCAPSQGCADLLKNLRTGDLVLARACAQGNEAAWNCFLTRYRQRLYLAARAMARDETFGRELVDSLYAELYGTRVKKDGRRISKLESFSGRGSLEGWLRTMLAQEFVNRFRSHHKFVSFDERLKTPAREEDVVCTVSMANQAALAKATDAALENLREEEKLLLTAYYLDGRTLAEIGRMLRTHKSTVSRRLGKITIQLRKQIIRYLCKEGLAKRAAEEMLNSDVRDLGIDVREKLAQERRV
jgi:RNA polymerase sigma-70 factor (ECF subfamily)